MDPLKTGAIFQLRPLSTSTGYSPSPNNNDIIKNTNTKSYKNNFNESRNSLSDQMTLVKESFEMVYRATPLPPMIDRSLISQTFAAAATTNLSLSRQEKINPNLSGVLNFNSPFIPPTALSSGNDNNRLFSPPLEPTMNKLRTPKTEGISSASMTFVSLGSIKKQTSRENEPADTVAFDCEDSFQNEPSASPENKAILLSLDVKSNQSSSKVEVPTRRRMASVATDSLIMLSQEIIPRSLQHKETRKSDDQNIDASESKSFVGKTADAKASIIIHKFNESTRGRGGKLGNNVKGRGRGKAYKTYDREKYRELAGIDSLELQGAGSDGSRSDTDPDNNSYSETYIASNDSDSFDYKDKGQKRKRGESNKRLKTKSRGVEDANPQHDIEASLKTTRSGRVSKPVQRLIKNSDNNVTNYESDGSPSTSPRVKSKQSIGEVSRRLLKIANTDNTKDIPSSNSIMKSSPVFTAAKKEWQPVEVVALYSVYSKTDVSSADCWENVSQQLKERGILRTKEECEAKWFAALDVVNKRKEKLAQKKKESQVSNALQKLSETSNVVILGAPRPVIEEDGDQNNEEQGPEGKKKRLGRFDMKVLAQQSSKALRQDDIFDSEQFRSRFGEHNKRREEGDELSFNLPDVTTPQERVGSLKLSEQSPSDESSHRLFTSNHVQKINRIKPQLLSSYVAPTKSNKGSNLLQSVSDLKKQYSKAMNKARAENGEDSDGESIGNEDSDTDPESDDC